MDIRRESFKAYLITTSIYLNTSATPPITQMIIKYQ